MLIFIGYQDNGATAVNLIPMLLPLIMDNDTFIHRL